MAPDLTLPDLLLRAAERTPDAAFLRCGGTSHTFARFLGAARAVAGGLAERRGPVVLVLPNGPEFIAAHFGALLAGRAVCALAPDLPDRALVEILRDIEPADLVAPEDAATQERLRAVVGEAGTTTRIGVGRFDPASRAASEHPPVHPDDLAVLQYTSGTTGGRKAARMLHRNLVANALQNNDWFDWTADDVILGALPFFHTWGMGCVLHAAAAAGASIALPPEPTARSVLDTIERERVTVAYGSATMFHRLLDEVGDDPSPLRSLRYVKAGAMLVGGRLPDRWTQQVPDVPMVLGYGLTEASPEVCNNPPGAPRRGTVGVALPGTEIRVCAPDDPDAPLPVGDEGEIQVRGPQVMDGYHRRPEATAAALLADGWLRTGDLGRLDDDGYLTVVDRLKDLIKFRGWSVVPAIVERALLAHPGVAECVVVGLPHDTDGEHPVAFVVRRPDVPCTADELLSTARDTLLRYEVPRAIRFVDAIPKNAVGKPLRRVLRARAPASTD